MPWLLLLWAAGARAWSSVKGPSSVAGWVRGRNAFIVWVVQGGVLPGSGWGQLVALSTGLSPVPRGPKSLSTPSRPGHFQISRGQR